MIENTLSSLTIYDLREIVQRYSTSNWNGLI